jgi:hypothetical protein
MILTYMSSYPRDLCGRVLVDTYCTEYDISQVAGTLCTLYRAVLFRDILQHSEYFLSFNNHHWDFMNRIVLTRDVLSYKR